VDAVTATLTDAMEWVRSPRGRKLVRFTMVSAVSTAVSFISIAVLYGFRIIPGVMWATLTGNFIASFPAYYLNRTWTWGKRGKSHWRREIIPFWTMSFLGIGVSQIGAFWARHEVRTHDWAHLTNTALVSATNLASFGLFWVLKLLVFNRIFRVGPHIDLHVDVTVDEGGL
jgi:putative flippase GtrA